MPYLLDADVFIRAKRDHYRFNFCPAFWEWIGKAHEAGKVFSIEKVRDELTAGNDELAPWARALPPSFFIVADSTVSVAATTVSKWANSPRLRYTPQAVYEFLQSADYWLVSQALAKGKGWKVVTHEVSAPGAKSHVKIPDACIGVGGVSISPFQMLEDEGSRFVLG
ncbi:MAG: DUF4411 family protein [Planctomycetes bacterium]|nr:DUF4411 family protein [Planctomycetota bacterium]